MPDNRLVIGTLVTGFYVIEAGNPERLSPVFRSRSAANAWLNSQGQSLSERLVGEAKAEAWKGRKPRRKERAS